MTTTYPARQIVRSLTGRGVKFSVRDGKLYMTGPREVVDDVAVAALVGQHSGSLVPHLLGKVACDHQHCNAGAAWRADSRWVARDHGQPPRILMQTWYWCDRHVPDAAAANDLGITLGSIKACQ